MSKMNTSDYSILKKEADKLNSELDIYLDKQQLVYNRDELISLEEKTLNWQGKADYFKETAVTEKSQQKWDAIIEEIQQKIDLIEERYLGKK